jgi:hypothetical protein
MYICTTQVYSYQICRASLVGCLLTSLTGNYAIRTKLIQIKFGWMRGVRDHELHDYTI